MTASSPAPSGLFGSYEAGGFYCEMLDGAARDPRIAEVLARLRRL